MSTIVDKDEWLVPVADKVSGRIRCYEERLSEICNHYGSLASFATAHHFFGLHYDKKRCGWYYREWAPAAHYLSLIGDFNGWQHYANPMDNVGNGVWEIFLPDKEYSDKFKHGTKLKVLVQSQMGEQERIPIYITRVVQDEGSKDFAGQLWSPDKPYSFQHKSPEQSKPLLIYEAHIGMAQEKEGVGTYNEFTQNILPRIKKAGYNTVQLMAIAEHPYYGSFGYHVSNLFAPSSRYGTPDELKHLVDTAHGMGLSVIMDVVHSHTVKNLREGINMFDGSDQQYLHAGKRGNHELWDSKLFNYGKIETLQLLLSNLRYWQEEYRFDGFRFDGVTSMIYLNHGLEMTFDSPDKYFNANVDDDAVVYLQLANKLIHHVNPNAVVVAEDVSGMPGLCSPPEEGGLGFDYRLGMGLPDFWIRTLKDHEEAEWNMNEFFFTINNHLPSTPTVAYVESHDQALVGDKTIAFRLMDKAMYDKMSIWTSDMTIDRGIALHKMIRLFTITIGGEAWLNFMGNEFGHPEWIDFPRHENAWSYKYAKRQWNLLDNDGLKYHFMSDFDKAMLSFVKNNGVMTARQAWLLLADETNKTIVYERNGLVFVFNWGEKSLPNYEVPVPATGDYKVMLCTDMPCYGGFDNINVEMHYPTNKIGETITMKIYNVSRTATIYGKV